MAGSRTYVFLFRCFLLTFIPFNDDTLMFSAEKYLQLRALLSEGPKKIALLCHTNPDGDTIGAALAWRSYLERLGHMTCCIAPNRYPYFLEWMTDIAHIGVFKEDHDGALARFVESADLIFAMDFNQIGRLDRLTETVMANRQATWVLIDHHLYPPLDEYALAFSDPTACSTSYIIYQMITTLAGEEAITPAIAESLYVGMMTDTGNFSFSNLTSGVFRAAATLIDKGVNVPYVNSAVYNNFSESRMRLLGYVLHEKMVTRYQYGVAYVGLTEAEMRRFDFKQGDSEGFVNFPLSIRAIRMSAMFIENKHSIRVSLRSRGDVDVNVFARRYFEGGGHRNAAGGKSFMSMPETIAHFEKAIAEYFGEVSPVVPVRSFEAEEQAVTQGLPVNPNHPSKA